MHIVGVKFKCGMVKLMKYRELVKIRAKKLYESGFLSYEEYYGKNKGLLSHVCWFSICVNHRNDWFICEECGQYDPERKPYEENK
jgi:hypothetical protein